MRRIAKGSAYLAGFLCAIASTSGSAQNQAASTAYQRQYCLPEMDSQPYGSPGFWGPMSYRVQQSEFGKVLIAEGAVNEGESQRLEQAILQARGVEEVWFSSPGGYAPEGPKMGRVLRRHGLATRLRAGKACISACSYAFLGGAIRTVEPGGYYGIHMFTTKGDDAEVMGILDKFMRIGARRNQLIKEGKPQKMVDEAVAELIGDVFRDVEQEAANMAAERARYLVEMSLSLNFMTDAFGTRSRTVCFLSPAGIARYNVSNTGQ